MMPLHPVLGKAMKRDSYITQNFAVILRIHFYKFCRFHDRAIPN